MFKLKTPPLASCPDLNAHDYEYITRHFRLFQGNRLNETIKHLKRLKTQKRWYVFGGTSDARYFTHRVNMGVACPPFPVLPIA